VTGEGGRTGGERRKKRDTFATFVNVFNDVQTAFSFDTLKTVEMANGLRGCDRAWTWG